MRFQFSVCALLLGASAVALAATAVTADTPLLEVWVPGSMHTISDHPDKKLNPLLNPKNPSPPFNEDPALARYCKAELVYGAAFDAGTPLLDRTVFERTMQTGREAAQARQVWQFNQARLQAQLKVVTGPRTQGGGTVQPRPTGRGEAAPLPRSNGQPDAAPAARPGTVAPRVTAASILGMLGLKPAQSAQPAPTGRTIGTQPSDINAFMVNFGKLQQELEQNQAVLAAQDARFKLQSQQYAQSLTALYGQALERLVATPAESLSLARLNDFEGFRANQIEQCIDARGEPDAATQARLQVLNERYLPLARTAIAAARLQVLRDLNATTGSSAFREAWAASFTTPWLRNQAEKDTELSRPATARLETLLAQEKRAREEAERRAAAEVARQAALLKKKYLDNAARNVPPTTDEVVTLATTYLMGNTETHGKNADSLKRASDRSFDGYRNNFFFGPQHVSTTTLEVQDLKCQPKGRQLACTVSINYIGRKYRGGVEVRQDFNETDKLDVEFQWTADGLDSASLKQGVGVINTVSVSSGGGSYGSSGRPGADRDEFNQNLNQFREDRRSEAARTGNWYMGESPQNLQREYGK